jgi:hypothetical protein
MGDKMNFFRVLAMMFLAAATPLLARAEPGAPAGAASGAARPGEVIETAFDPPVGRPLLYRLSREVTKDDTTVSTWASQEIIFLRRAGGYRMKVRVLDAGMSGTDAARRDQFRRLMLEFQRPFVLLIDDSGLIEGMEDADGYWAEVVRRTRELVAAAGPAGEAPDSPAAELVTGMLQDTTPEGRLALLTQYVAPIIEYGGSAFTLGEELTDRIEVAGMMGLTLEQHIRLWADRVENGHLFVSVRATVPREELVRAVEQFFARIPVTGQGSNNETERARALAELRTAQFTREYSAEYEVALDTGLTRSHRSTDRTSISSGAETRVRSNRVTLERQD